MKSDYELIVHRLPVPATIYPIADVHLGAAEHMAEAWDAFRASVLHSPKTFLVLVGDLLNNATRSSVSNIFEETMRPREQKRLMVEQLAPLRDRILCIVPGNHERRSIKDADDDPTYDIAAKLDLEDVYRPNAAFLKLACGTDAHDGNENRARRSYAVCVTHGTGGGIYTGATVNRNERFGNVIEGLDLLITGHNHKGIVSRPEKIVLDLRTEQIFRRTYTALSATSWLAYGGYAMQKMLLPGEAGEPQKINLGYHKLSITW